MPELPEVQTVVDDLIAAGVPGTVITGTRVFWEKTIATHSPADFRNQIRNRQIAGISRRGKFIIFQLQPKMALLVHLRMTGRFVLAPVGSHRTRHDHLIFRLDDGRQLRLCDARKFGRVFLVAESLAITGHLGPEPLADGFTAGKLTTMLAARKRQLKPLLLDQTFIAGLGNIYVDEALWETRLHPQCNAASLNPGQARKLHRAIRKVLKQGLKNSGTTLGNGRANFYSLERKSGRNRSFLKVFRRTGQPCPRCRTPIERLVVGQRSTHICTHCQVMPGSHQPISR
jgi:formamidopyrimidine-DNA glycosylase